MYTHTHIHNTQGSQGFARLSVQTRVKSLLVSRTVSPAVVRRGCRGLTSNLAWIRGDVYSASNSSTRLLLDRSRAKVWEFARWLVGWQLTLNWGRFPKTIVIWRAFENLAEENCLLLLILTPLLAREISRFKPLDSFRINSSFFCAERF